MRRVTTKIPLLSTSDLHSLKSQAARGGAEAIFNACGEALNGDAEAHELCTEVAFAAIDQDGLDLSGVRKIADSLGLVWGWVDHGGSSRSALRITAGSWRWVVASITDDGEVWWDARGTSGAEHDEDGNWTCVADVMSTLTSQFGEDEDEDDPEDDAETELPCKIFERGRGLSFVEVGAYIPGDGSLYRVVRAYSGIFTDDRRGNYVRGAVVEVDWDACLESEEVQAAVVLDTPPVDPEDEEADEDEAEDDDPVPSDPGACWDIYVGNTSADEFIAAGGDPRLFVKEAPTCADLDEDQQGCLAVWLDKYLANHITRHPALVEYLAKKELQIREIAGPPVTYRVRPLNDGD